MIETVPQVRAGESAIGGAGAVAQTAAVHDPGKILLDVVLVAALGGECLADAGIRRAEPAGCGAAASNPTVSRLIDPLVPAGPKALTAIHAARAQVRDHVWKLTRQAGPDAGGHVIVDIDGVLVLAHSEKQDATATWKKTFGPPTDELRRPGTGQQRGACRSSDAARERGLQQRRRSRSDRWTCLAPPSRKYRRGWQGLIRSDSSGGAHEFVAWLAQRPRWVSYLVEVTITEAVHQTVLKVPASAWAVVIEPRGVIRGGAWVAELDGDVLKG